MTGPDTEVDGTENEDEHVNTAIETMKEIVAGGDAFTTEDERGVLERAAEQVGTLRDEHDSLFDEFDPTAGEKPPAEAFADDMITYSVLEYLRDEMDHERVDGDLMNMAHISVQNASAAGWSPF